MTTQKDFKRLVRARMRKTGEAYTTARAQLLAKQPVEYAKLARMSDATIKAKTGCTWERWVKALDYHKAYTWSHSRIAEYVYTKYKLDGWWAQSVTVGYERIKGLRAIGQRRDCTFEATKSKVVGASLDRLYRAWSDSRTRARWLPGVDLTVRKSTRNRYMHISWPDATSVAVGFYKKGAAKSQVAVQHQRLPDAATQARMKAYWAERLGALREVLATR